MKPPGSSSRRPPLTGCSLPGASCGPGRCPAGPVPARAPPCRLLLVLLLLPALAASSRPRARGASAPSGGYGRCPLRCLPPAPGPWGGERRARRCVYPGQEGPQPGLRAPPCRPLHPCPSQAQVHASSLLEVRFCCIHKRPIPVTVGSTQRYLVVPESFSALYVTSSDRKMQ